MTTPTKETDGTQQLAAAEKAAQERFERAMNELREGAYKFSSNVRTQAELIVEELVDPEGECVELLAEVEGDTGALALSMPLELITFDTWLYGQIGDKEELDLKDEAHWDIWFTYGAWIGETMRRRHGGHWMLLGDDPHTWRIGFSKIFLEIAPFVFSEQLLRMGSGASRRSPSGAAARRTRTARSRGRSWRTRPARCADRRPASASVRRGGAAWSRRSTRRTRTTPPSAPRP